MPRRPDLGILFLHALPLDGSMWDAYADLLPGSFCAPTLYGLGDTVEAWAAEVPKRNSSKRLIVVGCSVGGSCALEAAAAAPERVTALVLIGSKARHDPEPGLQASVLDLIETEGLGQAWTRYWARLFAKSADEAVVNAAQRIALRQRPDDIARGVTAFHRQPSRDRIVSEFRNPIAVVTGADDIAPGPKTSAKLAASARQGSLHVIPGHYVPLEKLDALRAILKEVIDAHV